MKALGKIINEVPVKAFYKWLQFRKRQWRSREDIEAEQWARVKDIIKYAYDEVPFYHDKFEKAGIKPEDIKTKEDLLLIPVTTKDELRANFPERVISKRYKQKDCFPAVTSGSTGEPLHLVFNKDAVACKMAAGLRSIEMAGYKPGDRIFQVAPPLKAGGKFMQKAVNGVMRRTIMPVFEKDISSRVERLMKQPPDIVVGYTSLIRILAEHFSENGIDCKAKSVITTSEMLTQNTRQTIERAFNASVYDQYGSVEFGRIAQQCEKRFGYHINTENSFVEFLRDGKHAGENETAEIVVTSLINRAMPLIRYKIGDYGRYTTASCPCGRGLPLLLEIRGRLNDVIVTPGGNKILPEYFYLTIRQITGVGEFQVIQQAKDLIVIRVAREKDYDSDKAREIFEQMRSYLDDMRLEFDIIDSFPCGGGKHRHIIALRNGKGDNQ